MKRSHLLGVVAATFVISSATAGEIWLGVGKIGGDLKTSTEYAIGYEKEFDVSEEFLVGLDVSYKYARIKESEEERNEEGQLESVTKKVDEHALDVEGLFGKALTPHDKLFAVAGVRVGDSDGTTIYGVGVGVEYQHLFENEMVVSVDAVRHFMKSDDDIYYQTNTFMLKVGYEF